MTNLTKNTILFSLSLLALVCFSAEADDHRSRKDLLSENAALRSQIDSLKNRPPVHDTLYITVERKPTWQDLFGRVEPKDSLQTVNFARKWESYPKGKTPDSVYVRRLEELDSPLQLPYNSTVRSFIVSYSERNPKEMQRIMGLCEHYMPIFEEVFDSYGLPLELTALSIVESRLNPKATSKSGAKGLWQFMFPAARAYGLEISSFVDERMDVYKSTDAAARYLRDAYGEFGDWSLAVSAYNCGFGNVRKAIKLAGGKSDYWSVYPYLPTETRSYLPAMIGALYTLRYHRELGLEPLPCPLPSNLDTVHVQGKMHLRQVSEVIGTPLDSLRSLNPQYKHDIIPSTGKEYVLTLPEDDALAFVGRTDSIALHNADKYLASSVIRSIENSGTGETVFYRVKQGDTLYSIASRYGVSVAKLRKWNGISGSLIKPGQRLTIYK